MFDDEVLAEGDDFHCPWCGDGYVWDGRTEESRVCPECRLADAEKEDDNIDEWEFPDKYEEEAT